MNEKRFLAAAFILLLFFSVLAGIQFVNLTNANPEASTLEIIAMPKEYINYTITRVKGTWWAEISGTYPMQILNRSDDASYCIPPELPLVYPTPPGTTNIHVKMNETELNWSNYTEIYPTALHHTAIGDWPMIYCVINPVSYYFVLKIHYEHPVQLVNGSYLFLYDLNISPYLSPWSPNSTAYFTITLETNTSNLKAYTTETDSIWNPINYTTSQEGTTEIITIQIHSEYSKQLLGDLAITFSDSETETTAVPSWIIMPILLIAALLAIIFYRKMKRQKTNHHLQN
ncbi:MAG: hypothetical protein JSW44_02480 [Candidatus Bathyarchaeota archaeon]|nr:MAG: hypothetical protein JSW44_02480 [Candidatus Bathyarchaeota archaeon]